MRRTISMLLLINLIYGNKTFYIHFFRFYKQKNNMFKLFITIDYEILKSYIGK